MNGINFEIPSDYFLKASAFEARVGIFDTSIYIESPPVISFAFVPHDKHNNNQFNLSSSLLYSYLLALPIIQVADTIKIWKHILYDCLMPLSIMNSSIHYLPNKYGNILRSENSILTGSFFLKSSIEPFLFHSIKWVSLSPGAGLAILYNYEKGLGTAELQFKIGANYCFDYFSNDRIEKTPSIFVKFSFLGMN